MGQGTVRGREGVGVNGAVVPVPAAADGRPAGEELNDEPEEVIAALRVGEQAQGIEVVPKARAAVGEGGARGGEDGAGRVQRGEVQRVRAGGGRGVHMEGGLPAANGPGHFDAHVQVGIDAHVQGVQCTRVAWL